MKAPINSKTLLLAGTAALLLALNVNAQARRPDLPQAGFWVVETNPKAKTGSVVKFYNDYNQVIYEERLDGKCLDVRRAKTQAMLHRALDKAMVNWLVTKQVKTDGTWVAELRKR